MFKVITYKTCDSKPDWLRWRNEYFVAFPNGLSLETLRSTADEIMAWEQPLHLNAVRMESVMAYDVDSIAGDSDTINSCFVKYRTGFEFGFRETREDIYYRYGLQTGVTVYPLNDRKHVYHGCLTGSDMFKDKEDRLTLTTAMYFQMHIFNSWTTEEANLWDRMFVCDVPQWGAAGNTFTRVQEPYGAYALDLHAVTRKRRQYPPRGATAFDKYVAMIAAISNTTLAAKAEIAVQTTYIYSIYFEQIVAALSGMNELGKQVAKYLTAAYQEDGADMPPVARFGVTGEYIVRALHKGQDFVDYALPPMMNAHKPKPGPGGDMFISPEDLQPYVDAGVRFVRMLSFGLDFDWYNPLAYPRKGDDKLPPKVPDAIALLL